MTKPAQFIDVVFAEGGRVYAYRNSTGTPAVVGDRVQVDTARGWSIVHVVAIWDHPPGFDTKPIDRVLPKEPA